MTRAQDAGLRTQGSGLEVDWNVLKYECRSHHQMERWDWLSDDDDSGSAPVYM